MQSLVSIGCSVTARLDPLVPDLTDASPGLAAVLEAISATGVRFAAASYLFLRPAFRTNVASILRQLEPGQEACEWTYQELTDGCSGGQSISEQERRLRFQRLKEVGQQYGITIAPCHCKNPGIADGSCHIAGTVERSKASAAQLELFFHEGTGQFHECT